MPVRLSKNRSDTSDVKYVQLLNVCLSHDPSLTAIQQDWQNKSLKNFILVDLEKFLLVNNRSANN